MCEDELIKCDDTLAACLWHASVSLAVTYWRSCVATLYLNLAPALPLAPDPLHVGEELLYLNLAPALPLAPDPLHVGEELRGDFKIRLVRCMQRLGRFVAARTRGGDWRVDGIEAQSVGVVKLVLASQAHLQVGG